MLSVRGAAPIVLNAANEVAVKHFLDYKIGFLDIIKIVEETLNMKLFSEPVDIEDVYAIDSESRIIAENLVKSTTSAM